MEGITAYQKAMIKLKCCEIVFPATSKLGIDKMVALEISKKVYAWVNGESNRVASKKPSKK